MSPQPYVHTSFKRMRPYDVPTLLAFSSCLPGKMAAHVVAAAQCFPCRYLLCMCVYMLFCIGSTFCAENNYSRQDLLKLGVCCEQSVSSDFLYSQNLPPDITRCPGSSWITIPVGRRRRRRREMKQKRGCRAGMLARLRRQPHKPPLPRIFLTNARFLANKMDELRLQVATNTTIKDSFILLVTEIGFTH